MTATKAAVNLDSTTARWLSYYLQDTIDGGSDPDRWVSRLCCGPVDLSEDGDGNVFVVVNGVQLEPAVSYFGNGEQLAEATWLASWLSSVLDRPVRAISREAAAKLFSV